MILHFFCKIFRIVRIRTFMIIPGSNEYVMIMVKNMPNAILLRRENKLYNVIRVTSEIVDETLIYNWINVEEVGNINNK